MKIAFRTLLMIAVTLEIVMLISAALSSSVSAWWAVAPLLLVGMALALLFAGAVVDRRQTGSWSASLSRTSERFGVPRKALALFVSETAALVSVAKVFRRPSAPAGSEAHPSHQNLRTVVFVILGLALVEILVVHLAVRNQAWRAVLLVVSIYALLLLVGFYTSMRIHPHLLTPDGLTLRHGIRFRCEIPWSNISLVKPVGAGQGGDIVIADDGEVRLPVLSEVNIRIEIDPPASAHDLFQGPAGVSAIEFYCDDRTAFLDSATEARTSH